MSTGQRIKTLRLSKGLSQEELGTMVGVKKAAINKYENEIVINLKRSTIARLAEALDVSPSYLMGFDDEKEPTLVSESGPISPERQALLDEVKDMDDDTARAVLEVVRSVKKLRGE